MHEDKFEKQVREKMDQLGFDPADAVWSGVSKEINKEKKRRVPFFWLFMFSGLVLAVGGYYVTKNVGTIKNVGSIKSVGNIKNAQNVKNEQKVGSVKKIENDDAKESDTKESIAPQTGRGSIHEKIAINYVTRENKKSYRPNTIHPESYHEVEKSNNTPAKNPGTDEKPAEGNPISATGSAKFNELNKSDKFLQEDSVTDDQLKDAATNKTLANKITGPVNDSSTAKKTALDKKREKWEIGFAGQTGFSDVKQGAFMYNAAGNNPSNANTLPGTGSGPAAASAISEIHAGFSFGLGVFAKRNLSRLISISAGIDYQYYSTHVQTGDSVNSSAYNIYGPSRLGGNYYRNGSVKSYTNSYHFLELPVTANFQLNKSNKPSVILDAGLSFAYMLQSNALFFDPNTDLYVKSTQSFHKVQLNATTALMFGFHLQQGELRLGPQFQYGITGLTKQGYGAPEHLIYYGMKFTFIPRRK